MNNFLKEQVEAKERLIRDLEERLRRQSDEMRTAQVEVEQQSRRLKKREQLISQALRRLESINSMGGANVMGSLGLDHLDNSTTATASNLNSHAYNFDSINGPDVVTPVRPPSKMASLNLPSVPTSRIVPKDSSTHTSNKENDYRTLEF